MASRRLRRNNKFGEYLIANSGDLGQMQRKPNAIQLGKGAVTSTSLAGQVILTDNVIQSNNYISGTTGWIIDGAGNAEFGNVFVRGDINAQSGTIGYWNISQPLVTRNFGTTTLYGTVIESQNLGSTDVNVTSGTYVSLFKSYIDTPGQVDSVSRSSNLATLTIPDHDYIVGDYLTISVPGDYTYNSANALVLGITDSTITYQNVGNDAALTSVTGTVSLNTDDIAGLYLRDYGKTQFDYGYFSNKGMSYVSAENLNLVQNPSFEYRDPSTGATYSTSGWSSTTANTLSQTTFRTDYSNADYSSTYGLGVYWTSPVRSDYISATVDYLAGDNYKIFTSDMPLYLGLDMMAPKPTQYTIQGAVTTNTSAVTVTLTGSHSLVTGDYVYFAGIGAGSGTYTNYFYDSSHPYGTNVFQVTGTSGNSFYIKNVYSAVSSPTTLTITGTAVYKIESPSFNLAEIKLQFGSDSTTTLADVLTDSYLVTDWVTTGAQELSISASTYMQYKATVVPNMKNSLSLSRVPLDPKKIAEKYLEKSPTDFAAKNPFNILFPAWLYKKDLDGNTTATKLLNSGFTIDNIYLSKSTRFFYGDSTSSNNYWYTAGNGSSVPAVASVDAPKSWLSVDLDQQTAVLNYFDYIGFKPGTYSKSMFNSSAISTSPLNTIPTYTDLNKPFAQLTYNDTNVLNLTSGQVRYSYNNLEYTQLESYVNLAVDKNRSGIELVSRKDILYANSAVVSSSGPASLAVYVDGSGFPIIQLSSSYILADTAVVRSTTGGPSLNASYVTNNTSNSTSGGSNHVLYTYEATNITTNSSTYSANATSCVGYFTAPPSGVVHVVAGGLAISNNASYAAWVSFEIYDTSSSTVVISPSDDRAFVAREAFDGGSISYIFTGTPGTRYRIRTMEKVANTSGSTGSNATATIYTRNLTVLPIT